MIRFYPACECPPGPTNDDVEYHRVGVWGIEGYYICPVCLENFEKFDRQIVCTACRCWVHQRCHACTQPRGLTRIEQVFLCRRCLGTD